MKNYKELNKEELINEFISLADENVILKAINNKQSEQLDRYVVKHGTTVLKTPKPLDWLQNDKLKIVKGSSYYDPKITLRQCASWMTEYIKTYY